MTQRQYNKESGIVELAMPKKIFFLGVSIFCFFILLECIGRIVLAFYSEIIS